jgi:hypothetical protein
VWRDRQPLCQVIGVLSRPLGNVTLARLQDCRPVSDVRLFGSEVDMVAAKLLVERGSKGPSEDWGLYTFLALPSPADRVAVVRDGSENYLTVLCAHHQPSPEGSTAPPTAEVVAKWTGSAPRLR